MSHRPASVVRLLSRCATRRPNAVTRCAFARSSSTSTRQWSTPLAKSLAEAITTTGPISIAQYMRQCLTSDLGGYYSARNDSLSDSDQFGKRGDFITSPEISQIFGELVGIWFVAEWMNQGKKSSGVQLLELGPGRGTLMDDALRTIANFKPMAGAIETIYLVESSPVLREAQRKMLCGDAKMEEHPTGFQAQSKHLPGAKVTWVEDMKFIPRESDKTPFIVAHEFYDALPIHAFQSVVAPRAGATKEDPDSTPNIVPDPRRPAALQPVPGFNGRHTWRELLVSPTRPPSVINPPKEPGPEFELTVNPTQSTRSKMLPEISPRYKKLLPIIGATFEICPEARTTTTTITELISGQQSSSNTPLSSKPSTPQPTTPRSKPNPSGAALIIDYGPASTVPISTLRGIRSHAQVSPFSSPGLVDLSADVDFGALVETALESSTDVEVHGPVEQGAWLEAMGGRERSEALVRKAKEAEWTGKDGAREVRERLEGAWRRLVERGPNGMGRLYKVLAIVPERDGKRPVGFGGGIGG